MTSAAPLTRPAPLLRRALSDLSGSDLLRGLAVASVLAVPDLLRQLPVRDDPSYARAFVVDVVGVACAVVAQLLLVGLLAGERRWLAGGVRLLVQAVRRRPLAVLAGLVCAGAVSALLTLVPSVALLGFRQVLGPLRDPSLGRLVLAGLSDLVATAVTAPYFAVLVRLCAGADRTSR